MQQNDTKAYDNQNIKNQESVMHTIQKYNNDDKSTIQQNPHVIKKGKDKCIIF